jgi:NAD(P)-dependent dehydrogenase (short-subunit alcohol dehydrogenase family)
VTDPVQSPAQLFDLSGRVAIVTGASSGLGHRFAEVLHAAGASVVAVARRGERLMSLAETHNRVLPLTADLAISEEVERIVPATLAQFGRVDVLINNAGFGHPAPAVEEPLAAFRHTLRSLGQRVSYVTPGCGAHARRAGPGRSSTTGQVLTVDGGWTAH